MTNNIPDKISDEWRYNIALNIDKKTPEERKQHIGTMIVAKKLLLLGGYISENEAEKIQEKIDNAIDNYAIRLSPKDMDKIRIISLP